MATLTKRRDFLAANSGRRAPMPGFVLLVKARDDGDPAMRIGYTVTKKIGNAVVRNRIKRRFRALAREVLPGSGVRGADHVLIGRSDGLTRDFAQLRYDLTKALAKLSKPLPFRGGVGVGPVGEPQPECLGRRPTPSPSPEGEGSKSC